MQKKLKIKLGKKKIVLNAKKKGGKKIKDILKDGFGKLAKTAVKMHPKTKAVKSIAKKLKKK